MSTEQSESTPAVMAPQVETRAAPAVDITQQATTPTPTTQHVKNPKRVAVGKATSERTRQAREQQKKDAESYRALGENKAKAATEPPEPAPTTEGESPKSSGLSANQWIGIGGIGVSLLGIYYKREELKATANAVFDKIKTPKPAPEPARVEPEPARATQPRGLKKCIELLSEKYITIPELNTSQKIINFATTFGVTYLLLDLSVKVFRETFKIFDEAFGINDGEEEEVFVNNGGEEDGTRKREIARRKLEEMEPELIRMGVGEEEIRRIRGEVMGRKTD